MYENVRGTPVKALKKPWLQFLLLGIALFLANQWVFPPPKPVLGPPSAERLNAMVQNYVQFAQGTVAPEVLDRFIDTELRDELPSRDVFIIEMGRWSSALSAICAFWILKVRRAMPS